MTSGYLRVGHHPLLLGRLAWRSVLLLLGAAVVTMARAMAPPLASERLGWWLTGGALALFATGAIGCNSAYLRWSSSSLLVGSGRLVIRKGVPGLWHEQREVLLARVASVDLRWSGPVARACQCPDIVVGITGARAICFPQAEDALAARDALLELSSHHAPSLLPETAGSAALASLSTPRLAEEPHGLFRDAVAPTPDLPSGGGMQVGKGAPGAGRAWRRHPWWPLRRSAGPVVVALLGLVLATSAGRLTGAADPGLARTGGYVLLAAAALWVLWVWLEWWNDRLTVGEAFLRHRAGFALGRPVRETTVPLARADDFVLRVVSPMGHLFDYGDVAVGSAGAWPFVYRYARRPRALMRLIREASVVAQLERREARHGRPSREVALAHGLADPGAARLDGAAYAGVKNSAIREPGAQDNGDPASRVTNGVRDPT